MKKIKYIILGFTMGAISTISLSALANENNIISATLANNIRIIIDGKTINIPEMQTPIIYNDYTYLPYRYIADIMDASVLWDENTSTIEVETKQSKDAKMEEIKAKEEARKKAEEEAIKKQEEEAKKKIEDEQKKIKEEERKKEEEYKKYSTVPVKFISNNLELTATLVTLDSNKTKISLTLENKSDTPIRIILNKVSAIVDGKEYSEEESSNIDIDRNFITDVEPGTRKEGGVYIPGIPLDSEYLQLNLKVLRNNRDQEEIPVTLDIKLKK